MLIKYIIGRSNKFCPDQIKHDYINFTTCKKYCKLRRFKLPFLNIILCGYKKEKASKIKGNKSKEQTC